MNISGLWNYPVIANISIEIRAYKWYNSTQK